MNALRLVVRALVPHSGWTRGCQTRAQLIRRASHRARQIRHLLACAAKGVTLGAYASHTRTLATILNRVSAHSGGPGQHHLGKFGAAITAAAVATVSGSQIFPVINRHGRPTGLVMVFTLLLLAVGVFLLTNSARFRRSTTSGTILSHRRLYRSFIANVVSGSLLVVTATAAPF